MGRQKIKIFVLLHLLLFLTGACSGDKSKHKYYVKKGHYRATITETGELQAINSRSVSMPFLGWKYGWQFKIIMLAEHGSLVKRSDTVAIIDPSPVSKTMESEKIRLETEEANLSKMLTSNQGELKQIEAELLSAKSNFELIKLQVEKFSFEPENKRKIKEMEMEIASIRLRNIEKKYQSRKTVFENNQQIQQIKINQIKSNIAESAESLKKLFITSPIDGIFQLERNRRTRSQVQLGDDIHMGQLIAGIPDMSRMKILSTINENDIAKLKPGQQVIIRLDAYPDKPFAGEISNIARISRQKENEELVKIFDFEVLVSGSDPALKPGMTVSCEIVINEINDAFYIENDCIFSDSTQFFLINESAGKQHKTPVTILARNNSFTAISGDIKEGKRYLNRNEYDLLFNKP
ncbi:MAG: efflux RND transporter periplasmic adaptor subunit [Bacteroidales bacterium]|nr:efflux RND transporter periplasmic adaptor subunit [Bacteroidales bacterium]